MVLDIGEPEKMETIIGKESCGLLFVGIAREWEKWEREYPLLKQEMWRARRKT